MKRMTNSEIQTFKRCRRKWWLAYYRSLSIKEREIAGARALGTRVHFALAAYYSVEPMDPFVALQQTIDEDEAALAERYEDDVVLQSRLTELNKEVELARIMLEGYFDWLEETGADQALEVVANESRVEVPSGIEGVNLMGKLDLRVRNTVTDNKLFMDHKTVGDLSTPLKTIHMDEQMLHYHLLEHLESHEDYCEGGLYNMLRKVKRSARANPPFYERTEVLHNKDELRSYWVHVHAVIREILLAEDKLGNGADHHDVVYPSPRSTCSWDCDYFHVCPMLDDGSRAEDMLASLFVRVDPNKRYDDDVTTEGQTHER